MFGANDNSQLSNDDPAMLDNVKQLASEPADHIVPAQPQFMTSSAPQTVAPQTAQINPMTSPTTSQLNTSNNVIAGDSTTTQTSTPAEPAQGFSSTPISTSVHPAEPTIVQDSSNVDTTTSDSDNAPIAAATLTPTEPVNTEHLAGMKQEALDHLEPLVGHLDQSPEEAFKTTMMMIQANDNHTLLEKALDEAKKIQDDKARANAMLDIINEINYFSQTNQN